jgi:hypothetical protein
MLPVDFLKLFLGSLSATTVVATSVATYVPMMLGVATSSRISFRIDGLAYTVSLATDASSLV